MKVGIAIFAGFVALLVAAAGVIHFTEKGKPDFKDPFDLASPGPTIANAHRIRAGMTPGELVVLLGMDVATSRGPSGDVQMTWATKSHRIVVDFNTSGPKRGDSHASTAAIERGDRVEKLRIGNWWWDSVIRRFTTDDFGE